MKILEKEERIKMDTEKFLERENFLGWIIGTSRKDIDSAMQYNPEEFVRLAFKYQMELKYLREVFFPGNGG